MQDKHNICGGRIEHQLPTNVDASNADLYWSAVTVAEDALAILAKIDDDRKNESGDLCEPITWTHINTIRQHNLHLVPALSVLAALEHDRI